MAARTVPLAHFNDVYQVFEDQKEPVGGAARFKTAMRSLPNDPLVFFGGDAFNPSLASSITRGAHMVSVLNELNIAVAVVGNHDLDFGEDVFNELRRECNFPWLLSNLDNGDGVPVGHAERYAVLTRDGVRIGVMGLVEADWIDTLAHPPSGLHYTDFVTKGNELVHALRTTHACDVVVALTHMRWPNNEKLAAEVPGIDLILTGHDHFYKTGDVNNTPIVISGSDFRHLSELELTLADTPSRDNKARLSKCVKHTVTAAFPEDEDVKRMLGGLQADIDKCYSRVIAHVDVPLDTTTACVRTSESNFGSMVAGLMRARYGAHVGLLCGGSIRADKVFPPGNFTVRDLHDVFPYDETCLVLSVTGAQLVAALENGFSRYPAQEGRFPQISGCRVVVDPAAPPGKRIVSLIMGHTDAPVDLESTYMLACNAFTASGKDGYDVLADCPRLVCSEQGSMVSVIVQVAFQAVKVVDSWRQRHGLLARALRALHGTKDHAAGQYVITSPAIDGRISFLNQEQ